MISLKCPTPLDVKFHWAHCVKADYKWMEPILIGEHWTTQIVSVLEVWTTFIGSSIFDKRINS